MKLVDVPTIPSAMLVSFRKFNDRSDTTQPDINSKRSNGSSRRSNGYGATVYTNNDVVAETPKVGMSHNGYGVHTCTTSTVDLCKTIIEQLSNCRLPLDCPTLPEIETGSGLKSYAHWMLSLRIMFQTASSDGLRALDAVEAVAQESFCVYRDTHPDERWKIECSDAKLDASQIAVHDTLVAHVLSKCPVIVQKQCKRFVRQNRFLKMTDVLFNMKRLFEPTSHDARLREVKQLKAQRNVGNGDLAEFLVDFEFSIDSFEEMGLVDVNGDYADYLEVLENTVESGGSRFEHALIRWKDKKPTPVCFIPRSYFFNVLHFVRCTAEDFVNAVCMGTNDSNKMPCKTTRLAKDDVSHRCGSMPCCRMAFFGSCTQKECLFSHDDDLVNKTTIKECKFGCKCRKASQFYNSPHNGFFVPKCPWLHNGRRTEPRKVRINDVREFRVDQVAVSIHPMVQHVASSQTHVEFESNPHTDTAIKNDIVEPNDVAANDAFVEPKPATADDDVAGANDDLAESNEATTTHYAGDVSTRNDEYLETNVELAPNTPYSAVVETNDFVEPNLPAERRYIVESNVHAESDEKRRPRAKDKPDAIESNGHADTDEILESDASYWISDDAHVELHAIVGNDYISNLHNGGTRMNHRIGLDSLHKASHITCQRSSNRDACDAPRISSQCARRRHDDTTARRHDDTTTRRHDDTTARRCEGSDAATMTAAI